MEKAETSSGPHPPVSSSQAAQTVQTAASASPGRPVRSCGSCRACCCVFDIKELGKPMNTLCRHADETGGDKGCRIYARRPATCRSFECAWKQGLAGENDRPDLLGVLLYLIPLTDGEPGLGIIEVTPGAFENERVVDLIRGYHTRKPGRILVRRAEETRFSSSSVLIEGKPMVPVGVD